MPIVPFEAHTPLVAPDAFIAPDAWVIGKVEIAAHVSVFFNVVLRGDLERIQIGAGTNLQEHVLVHTSHGMSDAIIGRGVTVGHRAIIHGCRVNDSCLIGMGATLLDNVEIGELCIIGAHTLIPKGMKIPPRSLVVGTPAKVVRTITAQEEHELAVSAKRYQELGSYYRKQLFALASPPPRVAE
jgi:carbonic anhydrase/acetyltransferase-like protein (isoleucine patch superfamily)